MKAMVLNVAQTATEARELEVGTHVNAMSMIACLSFQPGKAGMKVLTYVVVCFLLPC